MKGNYIHRLQDENAEKQLALDSAREAIGAFRSHLHSAKFRNVEGEERRDWIAVNDVLQWLSYIENGILIAEH